MTIKAKKNLTGSGTRLAVVLKNGKLGMGVVQAKTPKQAEEAKAKAKRLLTSRGKLTSAGAKAFIDQYERQSDVDNKKRSK